MFGGFSSSAFGADDILVHIGLTGNQKFNRELDKTNRQIDKTSKMMDKALNASLIAGAAAFAGSVAAAAKFESQMANVNTLLDGTDENFDNLNKGVLDIARTMPVSMESLTSGLYDLVSAGADAESAIGMLEIAAKAATAGVTDVDVAIRAGMATMNAYALQTGDAAKDQQTLTDIYDLQFSTVKKGVLTYEQLANSLGSVLPSAAAMGVQMEEVFASLAHVTKQGLSAERATTALARAFDSMSQNTEKWGQLGIDIFDEATGKFRGMEVIMGELSQTIAGMTDEQKKMTLQTLDMNIRSEKAINAMINNYAGYKDALDEVTDSAGKMEEAFAKQEATFESNMQTLKNQLHVVMIELGNNFLPVLNKVADFMAENPELITAIVGTLATLAITIGTVSAAYKTYKAAQAAAVVVQKGLSALNVTTTASTQALTASVWAAEASLAAVAATIAIVAVEIGAIIIAMNKATEATRQMEDAQANFNEIHQTGRKGLESVVEAYETLQTKSGDALVTLNGHTMTVNEATERLRDVLGNVKNTGVAAATDVELKFGALKETTDRNVISLSNVKSIIDDLDGETTSSIANQIQEWENLKETVSLSGYEYKQVIDKISTLYQKLDAIQSFESATDAAKGFEDTIRGLSREFDEMPESMQEVNVELEEVEKSFWKNITASDEFSAILDGLGMGFEDFIRDATEGNEALGAFGGALISLAQGDYFGALTQGARGFVHVLEDMIGTTIVTWTEDVKDAISGVVDEFKNNLPQTYNPIEDFLNHLKDFKDFAEQEWLNTLDELGIETEASVRKQIEEYEKLMQVQGLTQYEIEQIKNKLEALYGKLGELTPWQQASAEQEKLNKFFEEGKAKIAEYRDRIAEINITIADLVAQQDQIDIDLQNNINIEADKIVDLLAVRDALQSTADVNLWDINKQLADILGTSSALAIQWEDLHSAMFGDYSQFEDDMRTAKAAIDKLLYFEIDLDTTNADEQINAAIFRMKDYLSTLSPGSQAYEDAKKALDQLIKKFLEMGGQLDREGAINISNEDALDGINDTKQGIWDLINTANNQKASISFQIEQLTNERMTLFMHIGVIQQMLDEKKLSIGADTSEALRSLESVKNTIDNIQSKTVTIKVNYVESGATLDSIGSFDSGGISTKPGIYYAGVPEAHIPLQNGAVPVNISSMPTVQQSAPAPSGRPINIVVEEPSEQTRIQMYDDTYEPRRQELARYRIEKGGF